ncbi:MAG: hypothetical protein E7498_02545 [Ruminococcus sp.]|nr:hypothetical protein [Ruminococcus sp.]
MSFRIGYGKKIGGFYVGASKSFGGKKGKGGGGCLTTIIAIGLLPLTLLFFFFRWVYRKTKEQKAANPDTVWYKRTWGIILMLILFFPIGLYLLWRYSKWNTTVKGVVTGIVSLFVIAAMAGNDNKEPEPDRSMPSQLVTEETTEASSETGSEATTDTTTESETTTTATSSEATTESVAATKANITTSAKVTTVTKAETTTTTTTTVIVVTEAPTEKPTQRTYTYVLNKESHKFHYQSCYSVANIKAENYEVYTGTRDEVKAQGYQPCGNCNP